MPVMSRATKRDSSRQRSSATKKIIHISITWRSAATMRHNFCAATNSQRMPLISKSFLIFPAAPCNKIAASSWRMLSRVQLLCGPYSAGASRHRNPLRLMKIIPLSTRRSSTRGLPWDFGKQGSRRAICASDSQKRSDMFIARFSNRESRNPTEINGS